MFLKTVTPYLQYTGMYTPAQTAFILVNLKSMEKNRCMKSFHSGVTHLVYHNMTHDHPHSNPSTELSGVQ